jgi:hypothetical protein
MAVKVAVSAIRCYDTNLVKILKICVMFNPKMESRYKKMTKSLPVIVVVL